MFMTRLTRLLRGGRSPGKSGIGFPRARLLNLTYRRTTKLEADNQQSAKASSKLLSSVNTMFKNNNDNPYYKIPHTPEQALEGDRMLMKWKAEGRTWDEIVAEWTRVTGRPTDDYNMCARWYHLQERYATSSKEFVSRIALIVIFPY